jgi:hypothetical protein
MVNTRDKQDLLASRLQNEKYVRECRQIGNLNLEFRLFLLFFACAESFVADAYVWCG